MLQLQGVTKRFGTFTALSNFNFEVGAGEIIALLGENGAGKSTAITLIGGERQPDEGTILWQGQPVSWRSPRDAAQNGIGVVHQHFSLIPALTVAQNLALTATTEPIFQPKIWNERVREWTASLGWIIDPTRRIDEISVGEAQRVEILKALFGEGETRLLLLDEPTANLTPRESDELFATLKGLRSNGMGIVFVSHKLREVMALCDRVVVLRRGELVGTRRIEETSIGDLAQLMVGRDLTSTEPDAAPTALAAGGTPRLQLQSATPGCLQHIDLSLHAGEIVAIAGVDGNGQRELFELLAGLRTLESGSLHTDAKIAFVPPDRRTEGLILNFDITENFALSQDFRQQNQSGPFLNWPQARQKARTAMQRFDIRAPQTTKRSVDRTLAANLSGGNAQKIVLARALESQAEIIVALDPTRGLDIGAATFVHNTLRQAARDGKVILLISTDLDEVLALGHRCGALYEGKLVGPKAGVSREEIGRWMGGETS